MGPHGPYGALTINATQPPAARIVSNEERPPNLVTSAWILLVDDDEASTLLTLAVLERDGYEIRVARSAEAALEQIATGRPGLILLDIQLPGQDGLSFARQLKADPATSTIPIVALTAHAMAGRREEAMAAGCAGYISKPIDVKTFGSLVRGYMAQSSYRQTPQQLESIRPRRPPT
jgi:two-component system, cell cycle response regulator DivK